MSMHISYRCRMWLKVQFYNVELERTVLLSCSMGFFYLSMCLVMYCIFELCFEVLWWRVVDVSPYTKTLLLSGYYWLIVVVNVNYAKISLEFQLTYAIYIYPKNIRRQLCDSFNDYNRLFHTLKNCNNIFPSALKINFSLQSFKSLHIQNSL